jgi:hypothetical protein
MELRSQAEVDQPAQDGKVKFKIKLTRKVDEFKATNSTGFFDPAYFDSRYFVAVTTPDFEAQDFA